jgi:hypothetical protein
MCGLCHAFRVSGQWLPTRVVYGPSSSPRVNSNRPQTLRASCRVRRCSRNDDDINSLHGRWLRNFSNNQRRIVWVDFFGRVVEHEVAGMVIVDGEDQRYFYRVRKSEP